MTKFEEEFDNCLHFGFIPNEQQNKIIEHFKDWQPQQALPVVPECVYEWIECVKGKNNNALALLDDDNMPDDVNEWLFFQRNDDNINLILRAWLDGYTVEKPQLFEVKMPIIYWDDDASQLTTGFEFLRIDKETDEVDFVGFLSNTKKHTVHFTEQEIKSIDERYWQFAVPVEDGE